MIPPPPLLDKVQPLSCCLNVLLMCFYIWQDVESANIFIGSLIFVQELAEKVVEVRACFYV